MAKDWRIVQRVFLAWHAPYEDEPGRIEKIVKLCAITELDDSPTERIQQNGKAFAEFLLGATAPSFYEAVLDALEAELK